MDIEREREKKKNWRKKLEMFNSQPKKLSSATNKLASVG